VCTETYWLVLYVPERGVIQSRDVRFDETSTPGIPEEPQAQYFEITEAGFRRTLGTRKSAEAQPRIQPVQPVQTEQQISPSQDSGGKEIELQELSSLQDLELDLQQDSGQEEQDPEQDREQDSGQDQDMHERETLPSMYKPRQATREVRCASNAARTNSVCIYSSN
jgi:hypothetical protein